MCELRFFTGAALSRGDVCWREELALQLFPEVRFFLLLRERSHRPRARCRAALESAAVAAPACGRSVT